MPTPSLPSTPASSPLPDAARAMVSTMRRSGVLQDPQVEAALLAVPRHVFLPGLAHERVYEDRAIAVIRDARGTVLSSSSQPTMMAIMLQQLQLAPGMNVLEVGTGTGYNAGLLQHIVGPDGHVTSIEIDKTLADQAARHLQRARLGEVLVVHGDGGAGYAPRASYDRIICTAAVPDVPRAWVRQLKPDGVLVVPITLDAMQVCAAFRRTPDGGLLSQHNVPCGFVPMQGTTAGAVGTTTLMGSGTSMRLYTHNAPYLDSVALGQLLAADAAHCHLGRNLTPSETRSFALWTMLHLPPGVVFAAYAVEEGQQPFGVAGQGFAVIGPGSAAFVPDDSAGNTHCFGGADVFLLLDEQRQRWDSAGTPDVRLLHVALAPKQQQPRPHALGRVFSRQEHDLYAWLDVRPPGGAATAAPRP